MKTNDCCLNALKHGFHTCPDCGQILIPYEPQKTALILVKPKEYKMAYIFDIDGTLADCSHRLHFILPPYVSPLQDIENLDKFQPDWETFHKECVNDKPIKPVLNLLRLIYEGEQGIIFVTGRPEKYRKQTTLWLSKYLGSEYFELAMRKDGDHRPDYIVKKEIYEKEIKPYHHIDGVFEDRKQCVDMWRNLGLTCYQVADGDY